MPLPEAVGIVIGGVLFFTVLTGIGLAVTMAVASAMLKYRSEAARMHLCRFGDVQFLPDRLRRCGISCSVPVSPLGPCWRE